MPAKRSILKIELDDAAKNRIEEICKRRGMTQISIMSRVVNWFSKQHESIQTSVLDVPSAESRSAVAKSLVKSISSKAGSRS